mgnify:FL=1
MLACFRELSQAKETYDAACQALDEADAAEIQAKGALRDGQLLEQQERDNLLEAVARWQDSSQELRLSTEELPSLKRMVVQYRSPADWAEVSRFVGSRYLERLGGLQGEKNKEELQLKELRRAREEIRKTLTLLRGQPEPIPPRREQIQATRVQLMMRGIPHAAFYEVVDFAPELGQSQRDLLEAQLADAGF